jgi:hypothetical protein
MIKRSFIFPLALLSLATLAACDDKKTDPAPTPSAPLLSASNLRLKLVPTGSAAPSAAASAEAPPANGKMAHCPNAVAGATTDIKDVDGGVEMTISATTDAAKADIKERAKHTAEAAKEHAKDAKDHTGTGTGGGMSGRCPVVLHDTTLVFADTADGTKITIKANDAKQVDWLRRETRERVAEMKDPDAKGAGERHMANCPSAAKNATTTVKEGSDSVAVTVIAKADDDVKEIRERAKKLVEAAKKDPTTVKHDGHGDGGGKLGRCPVVLEDTTVESKEVPGGVEVTVKPTKPADLAHLKQETKDRAQNFAAAAAAAGSAAPAAGSAAPSVGTAKPK